MTRRHALLSYDLGQVCGDQRAKRRRALAHLCSNENHSYLVSPATTIPRAPSVCLHRRLALLNCLLMTLLTLDLTALGTRHVVSDVVAPPGAPEWAHRLEEIGFIRGEQVAVMARGAIGGDPLVVRVGQSTFALRRAEAACVRLQVPA
jgi:ferrous iron transport protein A